ncbi:lysozyme [Luteolibacter sp. SL250]|uniref:lysozyme n=1 Tax=Luteolibacter sp. SL250 TaxID=2995170 RepID=UPI00226F3175|nr:lysozyme [Luteolibacter sp. SL250]WAC18830.1 lysozyme [Luteolibacter sp. SL250]
MPIRIEDVPNFRPTRLNQATMDPRVAGASGAALQGLAKDIASVSQPFADIANRIQDHVNDKMEGSVTGRWRAEVAALEEELRNDPNPANRQKKTAALVERMSKSLDSADLAPVVKDRLSGSFQRYATDLTIHAAAETARMVQRQSADVFQTDWTEAVRTGKREDAARAIERRKHYGLLTADAEKRLWSEFDRTQSFNQVAGLIRNDPLAARDKLKQQEFAESFPGLGEEDRRKMLELAEDGVLRKQRDTINKIGSEIQRKEITTAAELDDRLEDSPEVEPVLRDELHFHLMQSTPLDVDTRRSVAEGLGYLQDALARGEISMEDYGRAHESYGQVIYSFGARGGSAPLRELLDEADPVRWNGRKSGGKADAAGPGHERALDRIANDFQNKGAFGKITADEERDLPPEALADKLLKIERTRGFFTTEMQGWMADHPDADHDAFNKQAKEAYLKAVAAGILPQSLLPSGKGTSSNATVPPGTEDGTGAGLLEMVKRFEGGGESGGFHAKAYWDHKQWSIGYGTKSRQGEVIGEAEAARRLSAELSTHRGRVVKYAAAAGLELEPHQVDALTSFDYNTGRIAQLLAGGRRSKEEVAGAMLLYQYAGGRPLKGLLRRRMAESEVFRRGYGDVPAMADAAALPAVSPPVNATASAPEKTPSNTPTV